MTSGGRLEFLAFLFFVFFYSLLHFDISVHLFLFVPLLGGSSRSPLDGTFSQEGICKGESCFVIEFGGATASGEQIPWPGAGCLVRRTNGTQRQYSRARCRWCGACQESLVRACLLFVPHLIANPLLAVGVGKRRYWTSRSRRELGLSYVQLMTCVGTNISVLSLPPVS